MLSNHLSGLAIYPLLLSLFAACGESSNGLDLPEDPRDWTHEQLMRGSDLLSPSDTNGIKVLVLSGLPYQMGYQHGYLLEDEIDQYRHELENDLLWAMAISMAKNYSPDGPDQEKTYMDYSSENALDSVTEECEGLSTSCQAWTLEECVAMNSLLYLFEDMLPRYVYGTNEGPSCSQFVAADQATLDGRLIHGRNMDWLEIDFIMNNPLIIVRKPTAGLAHVTMMWASMATALQGMNEAGLVVAVDENSCTLEHRDMTGVPPMQLMAKILSEAHDVDEALAIIEDADHASCQMFTLSHGYSKTAAVVEMSASRIAHRRLDQDRLVYVTNHYLEEEMLSYQTEPATLDDLTHFSVTRYTRLMERLTGQSLAPHPGLAPEAPDYSYGKIDVALAIDILRDPVDLRPDQDRLSFPCTEHIDGGWALGNNHNVQSMVFIPEDLQFWYAIGWDDECVNGIYSPYVGFDLEDLLNGGPTPGLLQTYDPPYNGSYGSGIH